MRLIFDARYIRTDFHDGISRYSAELARAVFAAAPARGVDVVFLIHDEAQRALLPAGARTLLVHAPTSALEPFAALRLNRYRPDAVFSPMQTIGSLGRRFGLILTLHDTIYYRHRTPPRDLPWYVRVGWRLFHLSYVPQRLTLNAADVVHGGALFTLADLAFAVASNSRGQLALSINASISYLKAARGPLLTAEAKEVSCNSR